MSTRVTIKMVPGFQRILQHEQTVQALERDRAEEAVAIAQASAPRLSGDYADSIGVFEDGDEIGIEATDFKAHWIEFGTSRMRAFRTLTNAADEVADRVRAE